MASGRTIPILRWRGTRARIALLNLAIQAILSAQMASAADTGLSPDLGLQAGHRAPPQPDAVVWDSAQIIGNGTLGPFWLTGYFIIVGSETMTRDGTELSASGDYALDPNRGLVRFSAPLCVGDTVDVRFMRLSWVCPTQWTAAPREGPYGPVPDASSQMRYAGQIIPVSEVTPVPGVAGGSGGNRTPGVSSRLKTIEWHGFKSFALRTSSAQSADWSQNLELSVSGEPVRGLRLNAAVSDRTASTQDYDRIGSSRIGDLDRFFIETQSSSFYGRWGDITVGSVHAIHAAGLKVNWHPKDQSVGGYIARASGQLTRRQLVVRPNDAGPYHLIQQPGSAANVLSGTVTIWLDGHRLREGQSADYVFDQSQNTITFNPVVTLTSRSTVVAEFEQTLDAYQRTLLGADWSWRTPSQTAHSQLSVRWEVDDPEKPLLGRLTDSQRQALAGNSAGQVTVPASTYSGNGRGDYRRDIHADGDTALVYVGPGNGDWRVSFEWAGANHGRYRHLAESAYEYVGPGKGSYEPTTTLGAPRSNLRVAESLDFGLRRMGRLDGLWLASLENENRLAPANSRMLSDHRLAWTLGTAPSDSSQTAGGASRARQLRLEWRRVSSGDRGDLQVDDLPRFVGAWGLASCLYDSSRSEYQVSAMVAPSAFARTETEAGFMQFPDTRAWRLGASTIVRFFKQLSGDVTWRQHTASRLNGVTRPTDGRSALTSRLMITPGPLSVTIGWQQDRRENTGHLFEPAPATVAARWIASGYEGILTQYRWETSRDSAGVPQRHSRELSLTAPLDFHSSSRGQLTAARGEQSVGGHGYSPYYRGQLSERWDPSAALTLSADLRLLYGRAGAQQEVYLPTRPGQGQYRLERGEYVPDAHGDYRRVLSMSDDAERTAYDSRQRLSGTWRFQAAGWRWTVESVRERQAMHDPDAFRPGVWLLPWTNLAWDLQSGARADQHDYHRLTARPNDGMELTADWTGDRSIISGGPQQDHDRYGLSGRQKISPSLFVQTEVEYETQNRDATYAPAIWSSGSIVHLTIGGGLGRWNWSVETRRRSERERNSEGAPVLWGVRPRVRVSYGPLSVLAETDGTWVKTNQPQGVLPPLLAEGRPAGFSLTEFCEVRCQLPGRLALTSRLNADVRERGADRWRWELETTATF